MAEFHETLAQKKKEMARIYAIKQEILLDKLGLSDKQIASYNIKQLEDSLSILKDAIEQPDKFGLTPTFPETVLLPQRKKILHRITQVNTAEMVKERKTTAATKSRLESILRSVTVWLTRRSK